MMRLYRTSIPREDGSVFVCDTIQHDGKMWLSPAWLEEPSKPYSKPARLIGMSGLKYRSMPMKSEVDFIMEHPIPDAILQGRVPSDRTAPFVVLESPDIRILNRVRREVVDRGNHDS